MQRTHAKRTSLLAASGPMLAGWTLFFGLSGCTGDIGQAGVNALVRVGTEPAGANCSAGGVAVAAGVDRDANGLLDASEVTSTQYVCNGGTSGSGTDGHNSLVAVSAEDAGANCQTGGQRIASGVDDDDDGVLEAGEIDATEYVCNGSAGTPGAPGGNGHSGLVAIAEEGQGSHCAAGGKAIQIGIDSDDDGALDPAEVTSTQYICHGAPGSPGTPGAPGSAGHTGLVIVTEEAPGDACVAGGTKVVSGVDADDSGTLDATETSAAQYVCDGTSGADGTDGTDGHQSLVVVIDASPGAPCAAGGQKITNGMDADDDGVLDADEIASTHYVCNGSSASGSGALSSLVDLTPVYPGVICPTGGQTLRFGLDDDADMSLDAGEVDGTGTLCSGSCGGYSCDGACGACDGTAADNCREGKCACGTGAPCQGDDACILGKCDPWMAALDTYGPIQSIQLSNATVTERAGQVYQFDATGVHPGVESTKLRVTFTTGTVVWHSGEASGPLATGVAGVVLLARGDNTITIVHSLAGTDTTYTLHMRRGGQFGSMVFTTPGITMDPVVFDPAVHEYTLGDVPYEQATLAYTVASTYDTAGYLECDHCDWWQYASRGVQTMTLSPGPNRIRWRFSPGVSGVPDEYYYVNVTRGFAFGDAHLGSLALSNATITEVNGQLYRFTATGVAPTVASTGLTATFATGTARWANAGQSGSLTSGVAATVPLNYGDQDLTVTHTVAGVDTVYTIAIRRGGQFTSLVITTPGVTMTPAFDPAIHEYTLSDVPYTQTTIAYTVASTFDTAGYLECSQCDWWQYASRGVQQMTLKPGVNRVDWRFSPGVSGTPDAHYFVTVKRGLPFDDAAHLSALTFSNATLTETPGQLYQFSASGVAPTVATTGVTATFGAGTATWTRGTQSGALTSGVAATVPLAYGDNTISIAHTNGGDTTTYTVGMRRGGIMTSLVFSTAGVTMTPTFDPAVHVYALSDVPYETTTLSYTVSSTYDTAGYLECSQCDWWQYESRGTQSLVLHPGPNCINWRFNPGVSGVPDEHYYVKVNRGPVTDAPACP